MRIKLPTWEITSDNFYNTLLERVEAGECITASISLRDLEKLPLHNLTSYIQSQLFQAGFKPYETLYIYRQVTHMVYFQKVKKMTT